MRKSLKMKVGAVGTTFALAGALAVVASGTTGAYFSKAEAGGITGTIGNVNLAVPTKVFAWTNMMPGEPKTATVNFQNTGTGPQDFVLVFSNRAALHALNQLGTFGEVHVTGGAGAANTTSLFNSANLQDGRHGTSTNTDVNYNSCGGTFAETVPAANGCWPLPKEIVITNDLAPDAWGSVTFSFNYAAKLGDANIEKGWPALAGGGVFNTNPLTSPLDSNDPLDRVDGSVDGLPYQIVAVQSH